MEELFLRIWEILVERVSGPMWLRMVLQPAVAAFFAIRDGLKDAQDGRGPYFWQIFTDKGYRRDLIRDGWASIAKVFVMAMVMDTIYQLVVQRWIAPVEIVVVAFILAVVPYILLRGPINRIVSRLNSRVANDNSEATPSKKARH
jgi:hypothetical protein